jgi:hypothetical protein
LAGQRGLSAVLAAVLDGVQKAPRSATWLAASGEGGSQGLGRQGRQQVAIARVGLVKQA